MGNTINELEATIANLSTRGKGILAADESIPTITKRFEALNIPSTEKTRADYRELLITTPGINEYIAGVILFEETLHQKTSSGTSFAETLAKQNILAGIKVDKGLINLPNSEELVTQGLDGLNERLKIYKGLGVTFAKWRAIYAITDNTPSTLLIKTNAIDLARYAAICQANGIVPIVEPEVLIDSGHSLERSAEITEKVLQAVFKALYKHKVKFEYLVLKPSMVINGKKFSAKSTAEEIAKATVTVLKRTVPAAVPTINFLSGGQSSEESTANLNAINMLAPLPWNVSYSYARALQDNCMKTWAGKAENKKAAQNIFLHRAKLNSLASTGRYTPVMENEFSPT